MKSVFRIYAKTSKPNDQYLYNQLLSFGLQPKYQQLMHAFYCTANFNQILKLSYQSYTVQSLYLSIGHKYSITSPYLQPQQAFNQYFSKLSIQNYLPMQRNLIQNLTIKFLIRESSANIPSQNAMISYFTNFINKQIITKEYKNMVKQSGTSNNGEIQEKSKDRLENYYDIKQIVEKKWMYQDQTMEKQQLLQKQKLIASGQSNGNMKQFPIKIGNNSLTKYANNEMSSPNLSSESMPAQFCPPLPFAPNILMYIRRNHIRTLLKLNKQSMHKHGWRRNVGWGPIRQSLAASILYRTGLIQAIRKDQNQDSKREITLWDPFCGSGTFGLVALAMANRLRVRHQTDNFIWNKLPIYKPEYLAQYIQECKNVLSKQAKFNVFCSDIDIQAVKNSTNNFKQFIQQNPELKTQQQETNKSNFLNISPHSRIFQIIKNSIYVGHGDFQQFSSQLNLNKLQQKLQAIQNKSINNQNQSSQIDKNPQSTLSYSDKDINNGGITILTNLPYLSTRSRAHHQMNQLQSIYKRFNQMITKYGNKGIIQNVFVIVDAQGMGKRGHFMSNPSSFISESQKNNNRKNKIRKRNNSNNQNQSNTKQQYTDQQIQQQQKQQQWRIIDHFSNGGIQIVLLGWKYNKIGWGQLQVYQQKQNKLVDSYTEQKSSNLQQYRAQAKDILSKKYDLPSHMVKSKGMRSVRRVAQKKKERHLRALYQAFAKRRDRDIIYGKYARKNLVARLAQRGQKWKRKNVTLMGKNIENKQQIIKKEFENRIEEAIKRSEDIKQKKKNTKEPVKRKW